MNRSNTHSIGILVADLPAPGGEFQIFPSGEFRATDGRPKDAKSYLMTGTEGAVLIAAFNAQKNPLVVDYEHQALLAKNNGKPAPAAGWVHGLEWREGKGLYAVGVKWTEAAKAAIQADEYRYISPVFTYAKNTGEVMSLFNVALTNVPALDGMEAAVAHSLNSSFPSAGDLEALRHELMTAQEELTTLRAVSQNLHVEREAVNARQASEKVEQTLQGFCTAGKLAPVELEAARKLASFDLAALTQILDTRSSLFTMQSDRLDMTAATSRQPAGLTAADLRACELTGRKPEEFAALKAQFFNETPNSLEV